MKNYQQTPRQQRIRIAATKQKMRASKPVKVFEQTWDTSWGERPRNIVHHLDGRL